MGERARRAPTQTNGRGERKSDLRATRTASRTSRTRTCRCGVGGVRTSVALTEEGEIAMHTVEGLEEFLTSPSPVVFFQLGQLLGVEYSCSSSYICAFASARRSYMESI